MTSRKWITIIVLVVIIAAGAYWIYYSRNVSANVSDKDLITVQRVDFPLIISATGTLEATRSVSISPPMVRSERRFKLMRMVDEGTAVSEGDFLMEFDTSDIASRLRDETANFQSVQEERQKKRSDSDIQLKNLKLSLEQAKSDLEKLEVKLSSQVDLDQRHRNRENPDSARCRQNQSRFSREEGQIPNGKRAIGSPDLPQQREPLPKPHG